MKSRFKMGEEKQENNNLEKIFEFFDEVNKLKKSIRYSEVKERSHRDSTADHTWRLTLMIYIIADELKLDIDILKTLKIAIIHDLAEALTGDIDASRIANGELSKQEKNNLEKQAINKLKKMLPEKIGNEIYDLWDEYEESKSKEANFVKALDKIETMTHLMNVGWVGTTKDHYKIDIHSFFAGYADKPVKNFPELKQVLDMIKTRLKDQYEKQGFEWKEEYDDLR